jgi:hypothetical protein
MREFFCFVMSFICECHVHSYIRARDCGVARHCCCVVRVARLAALVSLLANSDSLAALLSLVECQMTPRRPAACHRWNSYTRV